MNERDVENKAIKEDCVDVRECIIELRLLSRSALCLGLPHNR